MLGVAQQLEIGRRAALQRDAVGCRERLERGAGAVRAEILPDRVHQVLDRDRRAPAAEVRRGRRELLRHEQVGLQMLDRRRLPRERDDHIGGDIEHQAPQHAVHQRRQVEAEQRLRPQRRDAERALLQHLRADQRGIGEARQEQRVDPDQEADDHAGERAGRGAAAPEQSAEERRRELRDGRERQQADRGELRARRTGGSRNRPAAGCRRSRRAGSSAAGWRRSGCRPATRVLRCSTSGMTMWLDTMIASATHSTITIAVAADRPPMNTATVRQRRAAGERQRQHEHVAVDAAHRERDQPCERDRNDEQVDGDQIEREQPARAAHLDLARALHHADMELPRQQHDREERQQRHHREVAPRRRVVHRRRLASMLSDARCSSSVGPNIQKVTKTPRRGRRTA